jgi:response regulator NasT
MTTDQASRDTKKRILVADDDVVIVQLVERLLQQAGYEVVSAGSGEQAVEIATTNEIDLAVLDYRMPGISGLDAAKSVHTLTSARVIMMSAHGDRDLVMKAAGEGVLAFIAKPLSPVELVNTVNVQTVRAAELRAMDKQSVHMSRAVTTARTVNTAIGMLMERLRISHDQAFARLRQKARTTHRGLADVCDEMVRAAELSYQLERDSRKPNDQSSKVGDETAAP